MGGMGLFSGVGDLGLLGQQWKSGGCAKAVAATVGVVKIPMPASSTTPAHPSQLQLRCMVQETNLLFG